MNLKAKRKVIPQYSLTLFTFIMTVLLPIISYFQFNTFLANNNLCTQCPQPDTENLQLRYMFIFITLPIIGSILTILRYTIYKYPRYSIKQGFLNLLHSIVFILFLSMMSQIGILNISIGDFSLSLNLTGIFLIIMAVWSLFILKNVIDLYDYKKNRIYYENLLRTSLRK